MTWDYYLLKIMTNALYGESINKNIVFEIKIKNLVLLQFVSYFHMLSQLILTLLLKIGRKYYWPYFTHENTEILRMWLANGKEPTKRQSQIQTFISTVFFLTLPCYFSFVITIYNIVVSLLFPEVCVKSFTCGTFKSSL